MKKFNLITCFLLLAFFLNAQAPKSWEVNLLGDLPELDGQLDDSCWQVLSPLTPFSTSIPVFGQTPHCPTEVRLFYTPTALYIAAHCFDSEQGGIRRDLGIRDGEPTGDWFRVSLDTWNDDQLAFDFTVTAAGIQQDARQGAARWDALWQSAVQQQADGWTVEICIPFTALRFPRVSEQAWGAQFSRYDRSSGELSTWSPQDPVVQDRVIQFGALTGIRDIRQERRHSLAVQAETKYFSGNDYSGNERFTQSLGIDSRIGLNESASLDFTILPGKMATMDLSPFYVGNTFSISESALPEPRQFIEEERDLFGKNPRLSYYPTLDAGSVLWRAKPNPDEFIRDLHNAPLLQASKLSARTRGNWRFGVFNALLGPAKVEYRSRSTNERRKETLQAVSDYLFLGAEYLLPNNSFVHLSNALLLAGPYRNASTPQLAFRLRDRSNSLEIAGASSLQFQQYETNKFGNADWNLALSRINRRWGWKLQHTENNVSLLYPDNIPPSRSYRYSVSSAQVNYRDFKPRGPFLNLSADANLTAFWKYSTDLRNEWNMQLNLNGLDRQFRQYTLQLYTRPHNRKIRYTDSNLYIYQQVSPELGAGMVYQTDQRKRLQLETSASVFSGLEGEFPKLFLTLRPSWVLGRRVRIGAELSSNNYFQSLEVLSTDSGRWIFEQFDYTITQAKLNVEWYPADRLQFTLGIGIFDETKSKRQAVELLDGGALEPVDWTFEELEYTLKPTYELGAKFFFSSISQLRFNLQHTPANTFTLSQFPPVTTSQITNAQLTFIWFLQEAKK